MRQAVSPLLSFGFLLFPALAEAIPVSGVYTSVDLGGSFLTGRSSASRSGPASGLPNVLHIQSWDGSQLGTQWWISCGVESSAPVVQDGRDANGTGPVLSTSTFLGGSYWFGTGPWGEGAGTLASAVIVSTVEYVYSDPVAGRANLHLSGSFENGCELTFLISNGVGVGDTSTLPKPADYPAFLDANCGPTGQYGLWGDVVDVTFMIMCSTETIESSWGRVKSSYR